MNLVVLSGNLGNDPESKYSSEGMHIASFSMAFASGKNKTGWIKVTCFDNMADVAVKHLHKGARVAVTGQLDQEKWITDNNETRSTLKMIVRGIDFIKTDGRGFENKEQSDEGKEVPF